MRMFIEVKPSGSLAMLRYNAKIGDREIASGDGLTIQVLATVKQLVRSDRATDVTVNFNGFREDQQDTVRDMQYLVSY